MTVDRPETAGRSAPGASRKPERANTILDGGPGNGALMILRPPWTSEELPSKVTVDVVGHKARCVYRRTKTTREGGSLVVYKYVKDEPV